MKANANPTMNRRRLAAELRRLRRASGLTGGEVAQRLLVSQAKISHMETGRRAVSLRDVRDLCALYGVADQQVVDFLMGMARDAGQQGWRSAYGDDVPYSVYIGLEMEAASIRTYNPLSIPGLLQTPAYARAVIAEMVPLAIAEQAAARLTVRMRRQHHLHHPTRSLRVGGVLDESSLRRVVGSPAIMREQLEHLQHLFTQPHITLQVLPHEAGAHPGFAGQFSILKFAAAINADVVHLERSARDTFLERESDVRHYDALYAHLQTRALSREGSQQFIADAITSYA
ncbi:helix-turn-helix transcriptional regulator [Streptomyces sp. MS2.AVA.5]|uniref:Helix-turn-helix transcriptional regulator n=1 Tax=Streptomyces achmelvichensis TaxID=3134111 RepID=A0ACC6Q8V6_9ACTN